MPGGSVSPFRLAGGPGVLTAECYTGGQKTKTMTIRRLDGLDEKDLSGCGVDGKRAVRVRDGPREREETHVREETDEPRIGALDDGRAGGDVALRTKRQGVLDEFGLDVEAASVGVEDAEKGDVERHR